MSNDMQTAMPAELTAREVLESKLRFAMVPGTVIELDPDEAEMVGAFAEDALTEQEALDGAIDIWPGEAL
ncbi:conjugal transfer protein TraD [uncultured Thiodictyon sp.]|uniref:conjugal transfer protein TraD n=1 Tax=uncultured Thiodictyon sp. TaxID=1846217 RepID=UPI0025DC0C25|nr:conjugal transfer protein TraD [uncultured Thiodictyon sp.]